MFCVCTADIDGGENGQQRVGGGGTSLFGVREIKGLKKPRHSLPDWRRCWLSDVVVVLATTASADDVVLCDP